MKKLLFVSFLIFSILTFGESPSIFNDTLFEKQWGLINTGQTLLRRSGELFQDEIQGVPGKDIGWVTPKEMEKIAPGSDREIVVAVLDSGLDMDHPDLKGKVFFDKGLCPEGEDNSQKPCQGINILKKNSDLTDDMGHGTHVAGIIAAVGNNSLGVYGLADPRIKILPIKVLSKDTNDFIYEGRLITDIFADGIVFAIQRGADVINMSIGWPKVVETPKIRNALALAAKENVIVVAASGNNNKEIPTFPCTNESVICVGATDNRGQITEFSNYGGKVDLLAPGEFIVSTYPRESVESRILRIRGYESKNGTSQASPFVAGIAASLKLMNPEMTNDELKARLYSSAHPMNESRFEGKFTKYGLVDMRKALEEEVKPFAMPVYKDLLDLNYDSASGDFFFSLPIKSLVGDFSELKVSASFNREDISLEKPIQTVALKSGDERSLLFKGKLLDLKKDTHFRLKVILEEGEFKSATETTIIFARNLSREDNLIKEEMPDFNANDLTFFRGVRKAVRMRLVSDDEGWLNAPLFTIENPTLQTEENTVISLVKRVGKVWKKEDLKLAKMHEVVSVRLSDLNLDGLPDYLVTSVNKEQDRIVFDYLLNNKDASKSLKTFTFPLLEYRDFPLDYPDLGKTPLLTRSIDGKPLKVPAFYAPYTMPEADNSLDILDRVPEDQKAFHLYFLNPKKVANEDQFELRVIDSLNTVNRLRDEVQLSPWLPFSLEKPFPSSQEDKRKGILRGLISVGEEFEKEYFSYGLENDEVIVNSAFFDDRFVSGNSVRPLLGVGTHNLGVAEGAVEFLAQLERSQVRSYVWDPKINSGKELVLDTNNWSDPVFNTIASFDNEERSRLIETRYFIQRFSGEKEPKRLRINRESSFPGVQFSETLDPVVVKGQERNHPGVFINSTLIFGNRLYSMVETEDDFIRPLIFSVDIPQNCVHLKPAKVEGVFNYLMLCRKSGGAIELQRMPLAL